MRYSLIRSSSGMDTSQIQFRPFHNTDPPKLVKLWHESSLGRGAAEGFTCDAFEHYVLAQPYFEKPGVIIAEHDGKVIGYSHAGFGCNESHTALSKESGVICTVMVHPSFRRQGIGRQLVDEAETFLKEAGAKQIFFGASKTRNPFYVGMYGGSEPAGFMESDADVAPFAQALGMQPVEQHAVFQRDMNTSRDPIGLRLMQNKRRLSLRLELTSSSNSWWWTARFGRLDSVTAVLEPKAGGEPVAQAICFGLDLYINKWGQRAVGIGEIHVPEKQRRNGYAQTLLVELCNRMKRELVTIIDIHANEADEPMMAMLRTSGFSRVDTGVVYSRSESDTGVA